MADETKPPEVKIEDLPKEAQDLISSLRKESAGHRVKAKELEGSLAGLDDLKAKAAKLDALEKDGAEKNGEFKKLYETTKAELDRLSPLDAEVKTLKAHFQKQLDAELEGQPDSMKELVNSSGKSLAERLELVQQLKKDSPIVTNSPAGERPGAASLTEGDFIKSFQEAKTDAEKAGILARAKAKSIKIFERLIAIGKGEVAA